MDILFINKEKNNTTGPHNIVLNLQRLDLRTSKKHVALQILSIDYMQKNITEKYKNYKLKLIAPTRNGEFELSDLSYSVSGIQGYIEYIIKSAKH